MANRREAKRAGARADAGGSGNAPRVHRVLAVLGVSPAVLTEFLWWLGAIGKTHVDGIEVWSTKKGVEAAQALIAMHWAELRRSVASRGGSLPSEPTDVVYRCFSPDTGGLEDIRTDGDAQLVLQQLCERVRDVHEKSPGPVVLHALISGGRKTMSAALQTAISLFGESEDSVYHVLLHPKIEGDPELARPYVFPRGNLVVRDAEGVTTMVREDEQVSVHRQPLPLLRPLVPKEAHEAVVDELVRSVNLRVREMAEPAEFRWDVTGGSEAIRELRLLVEKVASTPITVLIRGETGSGKELVARALHENSGRKDGPFVAINCAALPLTLVESELFGHEKGAFTDAGEMRRGAFEQAHGGTLFLDEVGELPMPVQSKLLRALQERRIRRIGASGEIAVDVRIVAATNVDLEAAVRNKEFREDLYYRLTFPVRVPALRERAGDLEPLIENLTRKHAKNRSLEFSREAVEKLRAFPWPGNVRELEGVIEYAVAVAGPEASVVEEAHLPEKVKASVTLGAASVAKTGGGSSRAADLSIAYARQLEAILLSVAATCRPDGKLNKTRVVNLLIGSPANARLKTDAAKKRLAAYVGFSPHVKEYFEGLAQESDARVLYAWATTPPEPGRR